ncbi:phage minor capsid protein [Streptosporangium saharense]|uniref:ADP ribosyltransferase domain-containing protein n=1 Tax=Streptosporangium saharense TaxID=1706840 RepID=A0A7W7QL41_9ACTN|nr:phage minor capsid protein [Streptosporangium saharense]MBB4915086.1 hypothetical protein [Streptosporangium saharense]
MAKTTDGPTPDEAVQRALERARLVAETYAESERLLAEKVAKHATGGDETERDGARWQEQRLAEIGRLRKEAQQIIGRLDRVAKKAAERAVVESWADGMDAAVTSAVLQVHDDKVRKRLEKVLGDARKLGAKSLINSGQGVNELARQTVEKLSAVHLSALRVVEDVYRKTIADTAGQVLTGARTRKEAARDALRRLRSEVPFRDKNGRAWKMSAYVDMAMRTATARAAVDGHLATMRDAGLDLVIVSATPYNCPKCDPWEGKILTQNGGAGPRLMEHAIKDGLQVEVDVAASVADARLAGLFHPNCKHSLSVYLPGVTKPPTKPAATPEGGKPKRQSAKRDGTKREPAADADAEPRREEPTPERDPAEGTAFDRGLPPERTDASDPADKAEPDKEPQFGQLLGDAKTHRLRRRGDPPPRVGVMIEADDDFRYIEDLDERTTGLLQYQYGGRKILERVVQNLREGKEPFHGFDFERHTVEGVPDEAVDKWMTLHSKPLRPRHGEYTVDELRKDLHAAAFRLNQWLADPKPLPLAYKGLRMKGDLKKYEPGYRERLNVSSFTPDFDRSLMYAEDTSNDLFRPVDGEQVLFKIGDAAGVELSPVGSMSHTEEFILDGEAEVVKVEEADGLLVVEWRWIGTR